MVSVVAGKKCAELLPSGVGVGLNESRPHTGALHHQFAGGVLPQPPGERVVEEQCLSHSFTNSPNMVSPFRGGVIPVYFYQWYLKQKPS